MPMARTAKLRFIQTQMQVATENPDRTTAVVSNAVRRVISQKNVLKTEAKMAEEAVATMTIKTENKVFDSD